MSEQLVRAEHVSKRYSKQMALDDFNLDIVPGEIVGFFGPNGAGKTTFLRAMLGLSQVQGDISVLGRDIASHPSRLMQDISFIADTAILPRWMRVKDCINYVEAVHPKFSRSLIEHYLAKTKINPLRKISQLSKGMTTQLHLALVMAIDSRLLVLDEPTLGLDIVYRKTFYKDLLDNYFDKERTILITTHQIEEIEDIVTRIVFINDGKKILDEKVENIGERFVEIRVAPEKMDAALMHKPLYEASGLEGKTLWFENIERELAESLGKCRTPKLADLFVAKVMESA